MLIKRNSFLGFHFLLIYLGFFHYTISAQDLMYPFEHFNEQNGLTAPVRKIIQDQFGFIWLGTSDGLYRYDGKSFKVFRNKLNDPTTIPNNIINDLCLHPNGEIWIASNGGLCYFDYSDNLIHQVKLSENLEKTDRYRIHAVAVDYFGQLWFASKTAVHLLNDDNELYKTIALQFENNYSITKIYSEENNILYLGTNTGKLVRMDLCTGEMVSAIVQSKESAQLNLLTTIREIYPYKKDTLLIASWYGGLHKAFFTDTALAIIPIQNNLVDDLQKNVVTGIAKIRSDLWWAVTHGSGIFFFDPVKEQYLSHNEYSISNPSGLSDNYINDAFVDNSGIVWLGTDDGMNKYDRLSHQFFSISIPSQKNEKSIYRRPSCILEDIKEKPGKFLWIGVPGIGLFHYNRQIHTFDFISLDANNENQQDAIRIYDMMYDHKDRLILCLTSGIYIFNEETHQLELLKLQDKVNLENVREILQDKTGDYWFVVGSNGIYHYSPDRGQWKHYVNQLDNPNSLPDNSIFCLLEDHDGYIWIGMQNRGLSRLNPKDGSFLNFEHQKMQSRTLPDNNVNDLYEDPSHFLWVATENGLARMNPERNEFKIFTTSEGLSNNDIFFITPDKERKLWLGTNNGLSVLNPFDGSIINYTQMDGLPTNRIDGAAICCKDGSLYFGTNSMISGCNPLKIVKNEISPKVFITSVKVHGQEIPLFRKKEYLEKITLQYPDNNFNSEFIALNYTNSAKNKYAYYLEGYDKHWNYCGGQTNAAYTNLPGGNYTFKIKATNNDGVWSEMEDQLEILVRPPFWNTMWFYLIPALVIFILIYIYFRIRILQIIKLQQLRLDIAKDLHDDVGSTLSSINMTSSMGDQLIKSGKNQSDLFHNIQSASRKAMEMMNDIVWSIKPENDKPEMMLSRMRQYASEILEPAGIDFKFEVIKKSYHLIIPLRIRKDLFMFFKEALNNLAKYSQASSAKIIFVLDKGELQLHIEDNGVGFQVNDVVKGNGLKNMSDRANALKANYTLESTPGVGTRIELHIRI